MSYSVLIVDDQRDTSKTIRSGLQSLGEEFVVASAMSGEEAMLEARLRQFDLLISAVRLPGMSGIELLGKLRLTNPKLKVILISDSADRYVRREVADSAVDAFLQKPIDLGGLVRQVQWLLGLGEEPAALPAGEGLIEQEALSISERLAALRQEVNASLALLLSDTGEVLVQSGELPALEMNSASTVLLAAFSAGNKISRLWGVVNPENVYTFNGSDFDLIMTPMGYTHALLLATPASSALTLIGKMNQAIRKGVQDLQLILADMGVLPGTAEETQSESPPAPYEEDLDEESPVEIDPELESLFSARATVLENADPDSFWEISSAEDTGIFLSPDALSYEQARQLGLTPDDE